MARSSYVYVVRVQSGRYLGAFTVKHEAKTAIERAGLGLDGTAFTVHRIRDGLIHPDSVIDVTKEYMFHIPHIA